MARILFKAAVVAGGLLVSGASALSAQDGPQNLDAGKSPVQLFASDCSPCHKAAKGLAKSGGLFGLASFLREHYTASRETAAVLAAYLQSLGTEAPPPPRQAKRSKPNQKTKADEKDKAGDKKPDDNKADAAKADPKKPDEKKADENKPADTKSADTKPAESQSAQAKSDAKASAAKPSAANPADGRTDTKTDKRE